MSISIEATYEDGVLKPLHPLALPDHERVQVTIQTLVPINARADNARPQAASNGYGLIGWTGDSETVQRIALDPEFGIHESP
jgi:predicted DNA-binding antitoxin AbrB/MazE fold protein